MAFNPNASQLSQEQILQQVFNAEDNSLAVDATVVASIGDVEINANTSSVTIGNPNNTNILIPNADGSINADVIISASSDSIKSWTQDGAGNPIGSTGGALNVSTSGTSTVSGTVSANIIGLTTFATSQYTVGGSAVQLTPSPLTNRTSMSVKVVTTSSSDIVYIGNSNGVTTSTGYPLFNGDSIQLDFTPANVIYAIGTNSGQLVYVLELA